MWAHAHGGRRLSPGQVRALFRDRSLGTAVVDANDAPIGVMPDLAKIGVALGSVPDVYIRDSVGDHGFVPSANAFASPDIIVRQQPSGNIPADFGDASPTANIVPANDPIVAGQKNYLYVRLRNHTGVSAPQTTATLYWSEASPLVAPIDWHLIGPINAGTVPGGDTLHVPAPYVWQPQPGDLPPSGHGCFIAVLDQVMDPAPPALPAAVGNNTLGWTEFLDYVFNNNNVAWRNFTVVAAQPATWAPLPFCLRGSWDRAREFGLELHVRLPPGAQLVWELPEELARKVDLAGGGRFLGRVPSDLGVGIKVSAFGRIAIDGLIMDPRVRYPSRLRVQVPEAVRGNQEWLVILRQSYQKRVIGQLTWQIVAPEHR
jgi:hypothetical protein